MPGGPSGLPPSGGATDPSMEDILASIRRILSEDEAAAGAAPAPPAPPPPLPPAPAPAPEPEPPGEPDVLALDASMLVAEPPPVAPPELGLQDLWSPEPAEPPRAEPAPDRPPAVEPVAFEPVDDGLLAPAAAAAAAASLGTLARTLAGHHAMSVYRGGPTLEDIVREEMRPMLKSWLDENLPPLVERLVRAEIERVVGRVAS